MIFEVKLKTALKIGNITKDRFTKTDHTLGALNFEKERDMITISGGLMADYLYMIPVANCEYIKMAITEKPPLEQPRLIEESMEPVSKAAGKKKK